MLVETIIVVSDMGEIWFPHIAPDKIDPSVGKSSGMAVGRAGVVVMLKATSIGMVMGSKSMITPKAEPVIPERISETVKISIGMRGRGRRPRTRLAKYDPECKSD